MYNALIKQDYINQYTGITGNNTFQNLFSSTEVYEIMWNKDVCNFVRDEIIEYLRSIGATSVSTLATKVSLLRNYTYWCCENQFTKDGINHFNEILPDDYYDCVNKKEATTIMTEEEIIEVLDQLINPSE